MSWKRLILFTILKFLLVQILSQEQARANLVDDSFWWGNVNGVNYLTIQRNQNSPQYCSASWAFSTTSALSDRIKILRKAKWQDIIISPQVLLSCSENNYGCKGGNTQMAYEWISKNNITDVTCSPYQARDTAGGLGCTSKLKCINCQYNPKQCDPQPRGKIYGISKYGLVQGEHQMIKQIQQNGPITCSLDLSQQFIDYTGGIFNSNPQNAIGIHHVSITGWGVQNGVKYWQARNSWGSFWGEGGDIRIIRGINSLNIETNCSWAMPIDTWTKDIRNETKLSDYLDKLQLSQSRERCKRQSPRLIPEVVKSPRPHQYLNLKDLPQNWDWRNVSGVNYMSWTKNQWAPHNCGDCWIEATTSALADRINIARNRTWPDLTLAPQVIINCKYGGSCNGGNPGHVYKYAMQFGLPEQSCQAFRAKDPDHFFCSQEQICHKCGLGGCQPQKKYVVWKVTEHGLVQGSIRMKAQIYARGPITCGIDATAKWQAYTGGIFSQSKLVLNENHEISVVGWGKQNGVQYWIGRNSYGSHWGENGFFRITMHRNNLGLELECSWAAVDKQPHIIQLEDFLQSQ